MSIRGEGIRHRATEKRWSESGETASARARDAEKHLRRATEERAKPFALVHGIAPEKNESEPMYLARIETLRLAADRAQTVDKWKHKNEGTAETHENWERRRKRPGSLAKMVEDGQIDQEQLGWACEIASVAEAIERDVEVKISKYRMPVDNEASGKDALVEGIMRVRREIAYGWWRQRIPHPRRAVLDMLVGDPLSYSAAARRWRMGKRRAKMILLDAIDLWPEAMEYATKSVDEGDLIAAHAGLLGG